MLEKNAVVKGCLCQHQKNLIEGNRLRKINILKTCKNEESLKLYFRKFTVVEIKSENFVITVKSSVVIFPTCET